ncbi:hypothetical protein [Tenacibaculum soleae]|uniref:hypothetical protein n=1 Tax=Tenacibaculum soleae TaxID=447689 RepID=UPI0026E1D583|nr:hypothetical protein [Tenacibaculum soleae]MDO6814029.1 hypothetical protein [Tenacibaculum soleae]
MKFYLKTKNHFLPLILVLFIGCTGNSQVKQNNEEAIKHIKSKETKDNIEKLIIGYWNFEKLITPSGKDVESDFIEKNSRPNILFKKNKKYILFNKTIENGNWSYNVEDEILDFVFDKPQYSVPIDKISSELFQKLKKEGKIFEFKGDSWEIHSIIENELLIIEHLPHNEFELKYVLRKYRKVNK